MTNGVAVSHLPQPAGSAIGAQSADYKALIANQGQLVVVPLDQMVASTSGIATEAGPWVTLPGCVSPPANFHLDNATDAQLAMYGFPPVGAMPRAQYDTKYAWMKHRACQSRATNGPLNGMASASQSKVSNAHQLAQGASEERIENAIWGGYVADENNCPTIGMGCAAGTPNYYTEADTDWYVPTVVWPGNCIPLCNSSFWVGLGGARSQDELIQTGVADNLICSNLCALQLYPWIEWVGDAGTVDPIEVNVPGIHWTTHVYSAVWASNYYELGNLDTGLYYGWTEGPAAAENSAEFIAEDVNQQGFVDFGSITFYGMGVTTQSGYHPVTGVPYDKEVIYWHNDGVDQLIWDNAIASDPGDYPYDESTLDWMESCPGICS
ncbi:MAG TPA: G1 family glutamic endopeptidase [Ktedonobacterales bacterium]|nr:G1 family glutamic endopeptidase [Ktedonobacterales bacterium]